MTTEMISKIQKLLRTSADAGATPEEANTAFNIAQRLMQTHRITEEAIAAHARGEAATEGRIRVEDMTKLVLGKRRYRQDGTLAMAVGAVCGVGVYHSEGPFGQGKILVGYGLPADLAVAKELFAWVVSQMDKRTRAFCREHKTQRNQLAGRSFMDGFAGAVYAAANEARTKRERSTETVAAANAEGQVLALVCVGTAQQELSRALAVKAKQLGLGVGRGRRVSVSWSARDAGAAAGSKVNLSRSVVK